MTKQSVALQKARRAAYAAFSTLWEEGSGRRREDAYRLLTWQLGIDGADCRFSTMTEEMLLRVPPAVEAIKRGRDEPASPQKLVRRAQSARMPKCQCGNILSQKRTAEGITRCPACERLEQGGHP